VHASTDAKQPIAIIIPHESHLRRALEERPVQGVDAHGDLHALCAASGVQELVMRECNALGKKNGFKPMEMLEAVILTADEWTPENGLVTAAQKVQRKKIAEKFDAQIKVRLSWLSFFVRALVSDDAVCTQKIYKHQ
jgi:long-chain acyl-CoA synthetase